MGCGGSKSSEAAPKNNPSGEKNADGTAGTAASSGKSGKGGKEGQKRLLDFYNVGEMLGQGAFGIVYACTSKENPDQQMAVKMVDKAESPLDKIREEFGMLQRMDCENIIKCRDVIIEKCFVCIVMDRLSGGDLIVGMQAHWKSKGKIPVMATVPLTVQMAKSLAYLHSVDVVHRDVKGDNYLCDRANIVDAGVKIVLTDFGTAKDCKESDRLKGDKEKCGTKLYWSPEFYKMDYSQKVDVWAMGVIVYGLINGKFPFKDARDMESKSVTVPKGTPSECSNFVMAVLEKAEGKRLKSADVLKHNWLGGKLSNSGGDVHNTEEWKPEIEKEDNAAAGVGERRNELVERMQDKGKKEKQKGEEHYWKEWFSIVDRHAKNSTLKYEWWSENKIKEQKVLSTDGKVGHADQATNENERTVQTQLESHGIITDGFGKNTAKTMKELAHEVHTGACVLFLDASEHKKLVRVVDVVLLKINAPDSKNKIFVEAKEKYADGRERPIIRLPGTKKEPHMNAKQVADKIVAESMDLNGATIKFDFKQSEVFEESEESPSYPGLQTVYRKEIISGEVVSDIKNVRMEKKDTKGVTKFFAWMTTAELDKKEIKYQAPKEGDEVSGLVQAPIGMTEEALRDYLIRNKVDIEKFEGKNRQPQAKTLKDISAELMKGESQLMVDQKGALIRVVDVVVIKLVHNVSGSVLVQTEQTLPDGTKTDLKRLPGAKRRPDENQFLTARRILKRQLKIEENHVTLDATTVSVVEEIKESVAYPGLLTTYRKRIITAKLAKNE